MLSHSDRSVTEHHRPYIRMHIYYTKRLQAVTSSHKTNSQVRTRTGKHIFSPVQLTTSRIGNLTRLTHTLLCDDHTYHVAVSQRTNRSPCTTNFCLFIGYYHPARYSGQPLDLARPLSHSVLLHPLKHQVSQTLACTLVHILHTEFLTFKRNCPYFISLVYSRPHIISPTTDRRGLSRSDPARASSKRLSYSPPTVHYYSHALRAPVDALIFVQFENL